MPYSTKQHQAVLRCLEARGETACTAAELAEDLRREGCPVGLATIYRQLEKLEITEAPTRSTPRRAPCTSTAAASPKATGIAFF